MTTTITTTTAAGETTVRQVGEAPVEAFVADRQVFWGKFTRFVTFGTIGIIVLLVLLDWFLVA